MMVPRDNADVNTPTLRNVLGVPNYKEVRAGANLVWTPVTDFDVGVEFSSAGVLVDLDCLRGPPSRSACFLKRVHDSLGTNQKNGRGRAKK